MLNDFPEISRDTYIIIFFVYLSGKTKKYIVYIAAYDSFDSFMKYCAWHADMRTWCWNYIKNAGAWTNK